MSKSPRNLVKFVQRHARASKKQDQSLSYCQQLESLSKRLGYRNYNALKSDDIARKLRCAFETRRNFCANLLPDDTNNDYYQFHVSNDGRSVGYYSHWTGYDSEGYELREPSIIRGEILIKAFREELGADAYVIEDVESLYQWLFVWRGYAIINSQIAENTPSFAHRLEPSRSTNPRHRRLTAQELKEIRCS